MMNRILKRPMFRMGGRSDDGIMSVGRNDGIMSLRRGYQEGDQVLPVNTEEYRSQVEKELFPNSLLGVTNRVLGGTNDFLYNFGVRPLGNIAQFITKTNPEYIEPKDSKEEMIDLILKNRGVDLDADSEKPVNRIPIKTNKKKVPQDPEKELLDIYADNKGIIDQVMGNSDENTKRQLYLQLAKFGAGLAAQPGGDLVGAVGRAAADPLEGVGQVLADKQKAEKDIKTLALQKSFDDMKEPEQIKFVKAIQKEYGLDTFGEAYDLVTKSKKSSAQINADNAYYRDKGKQLGVSEEGFRREMDKLDDAGLGPLIGELTRPDAALPEDIDDRVNGEYYVRPNGQAVRSVDGKLYELGDPEFTAEIKATKKK